MKILKNAFVALSICSVLIACSNDDDNEEKTGSVVIEFSNIVKDNPLALEKVAYMNQSEESYTVSIFRYILSNIVLTKENGDEFTYPVEESYFLINEEEAESKKITLTDIPAGTYTKISFGVGIPQSTFPLEGANFIPKAEENNMIWSWTAGYQFVKLEGFYTTEANPEQKDFKFHIGSHGTNLDNYREVDLNISQKLQVEGNDTVASLLINADVAKIFDGVESHSLEVKNDIQVDPLSPKIAANIQTMFSIP